MLIISFTSAAWYCHTAHQSLENKSEHGKPAVPCSHNIQAPDNA